MSAACKTITRRFTFDGYAATVSVPLVCGQPMAVEIEWNAPKPPHLRGRSLARYQQLRNAVLKTLAVELGGPITVVDVLHDGELALTEIEP